MTQALSRQCKVSIQGARAGVGTVICPFPPVHSYCKYVSRPVALCASEPARVPLTSWRQPPCPTYSKAVGR